MLAYCQAARGSAHDSRTDLLALLGLPSGGCCVGLLLLVLLLLLLLLVLLLVVAALGRLPSCNMRQAYTQDATKMPRLGRYDEGDCRNACTDTSGMLLVLLVLVNCCG